MLKHPCAAPVRRGRRLGPALLLLVGAACSHGPSGAAGEAAAFGARPLVEGVSAAHGLRLSARSAPQPPRRGDNTVRLQIADAHGQPALGLALALTPYMPSMGHGVPFVPEIRDCGGGLYEARHVAFSMAGGWELRGKVTRPFEDTFALPVEIE